MLTLLTLLHSVLAEETTATGTATPPAPAATATDTPASGVLRTINFPFMVGSDLGGPTKFQILVLSVLILLFCLFPSKKMQKFQDAVLTGVNIYIFAFEMFVHVAKISPMNIMFLIATFGAGFVLSMSAGTKRLVDSVSNTFIVTIFAAALLGFKSLFFFYILELLTGTMTFFLISNITFLHHKIITTSTYAYLGLLILSVIIRPVGFDVFSNVFTPGLTISAGAPGKFIMLIFLIVAFFLPTVLSLFKVAIFGLGSDDVEKPKEVEKDTESV